MSSINPNNIDGQYPIAGQDNDSQGFRDNFTNIKNNLTFAKTELEDLQSKVLLKSPLSGTTLSNDLNNVQLVNPQLIQVTETINDLGTLDGTVTVNWEDAHFQIVTTDGSGTGSIELAFTGWPTSGYYAKMRLAVNVDDVGDTVTLPTSDVTIGLASANANVSTGTISYGATGTYMYEFSTWDGGTNVAVIDLLK